MNSLDVLTTSPQGCCKKRIGTGKESFYFDDGQLTASQTTCKYYTGTINHFAHFHPLFT